jgi:hypothetical protein
MSSSLQFCKTIFMPAHLSREDVHRGSAPFLQQDAAAGIGPMAKRNNPKNPHGHWLKKVDTGAWFH